MWVVCRGDVERTIIGSLAEESGWKWMASPNVFPGIIAKWTNAGKSRCIAGEEDASRTPNGNKWDAARMYIGCQPKYTRHIPDTNALSVLNTLYTRCIRLHPF